jgi:hypothetical protein
MPVLGVVPGEEALAEGAGVGSNSTTAASDALPATAHFPALVLDHECGSTRAASAPGAAFFEAWMRLAAAGERAAVVLAPRAGDPDHLAAREIASLVV